MLAERDVEARLGRGDELVAQQQLDERARGVERLGGAPRVATASTHAPRWRRSAARPGAASARARAARRGGRRRRRPTARRARLGVEQHGARVDRPDAVHQAMVRLGGQRPAPAGEALEQDDAPQRPSAVEPVRPEVGRPGEQLALAARLGQRGAGDVGGDVEVLVGHPRRPMQAARRAAREPLAIARERVEAPVEVAAQPRERGCAAVRERVEDQHPSDVHVRSDVGLLELEEGRVEWGERLGRRHALNLPSRRHGNIRRTRPSGSVLRPGAVRGFPQAAPSATLRAWRPRRCSCSTTPATSG